MATPRLGTVKQLVAALLTCDQDTPVLVSDAAATEFGTLVAVSRIPEQGKPEFIVIRPSLDGVSIPRRVLEADWRPMRRVFGGDPEPWEYGPTGEGPKAGASVTEGRNDIEITDAPPVVVQHEEPWTP